VLFGTRFLQSFKIIGGGGRLVPPASPLVSAYVAIIQRLQKLYAVASPAPPPHSVRHRCLRWLSFKWPGKSPEKPWKHRQGNVPKIIFHFHPWIQYYILQRTTINSRNIYLGASYTLRAFTIPCIFLFWVSANSCQCLLLSRTPSSIGCMFGHSSANA
jgi:hypothetical protein